ncbi:MAG: response regulator [Cytophagaceae bacterium]|nr:MAG: response regulator [Cytophagaceae bacterium]
MGVKRIEQGKLITNRVPILIIEPNADHWLIIRATLAQCFPEVVPVWVNQTSQVKDYLTSLGEKKAELPQMIVTELYLPDRQSGLSLLEELKSNPPYQRIPTIVLSDSSSSKDVTAAYRFKIASYMVKPTTSQEWLTSFHSFRQYWWELVRLPRLKLP